MSAKTIGILQPVYLPWLGYFEQIARVDHFVFMDDVQYTRRDWRNRNRILSKNGPLWLTVPVKKAPRDTPIHEIVIDDSKDWAHKHLKAIRLSYARTPYLDWVYPDLERLLSQHWSNLADLNIALVRMLCTLLEISTPTSRASENPLSPIDEPDASKNRIRNLNIIALCQQQSATVLYDGAKAREFIDLDLFGEHEISVVFQNYRHPRYPQPVADFESHLSVLDLLVNTGPKARDILLSSPVDEALMTTPTSPRGERHS